MTGSFLFANRLPDTAEVISPGFVPGQRERQVHLPLCTICIPPVSGQARNARTSSVRASPPHFPDAVISAVYTMLIPPMVKELVDGEK